MKHLSIAAMVIAGIHYEVNGLTMFGILCLGLYIGMMPDLPKSINIGGGNDEV